MFLTNHFGTDVYYNNTNLFILERKISKVLFAKNHLAKELTCRDTCLFILERLEKWSEKNLEPQKNWNHSNYSWRYRTLETQFGIIYRKNSRQIKPIGKSNGSYYRIGQHTKTGTCVWTDVVFKKELADVKLMGMSLTANLKPWRRKITRKELWMWKLPKIVFCKK